MMKKSCDNVVIVTGANGGVGQILVKKLLEKNYAVAGVDKIFGNELLAISKQQELLKLFKCNAADEKEIETTVIEIYKTFGKITHLINAIGIEGNYPLSEVTYESFERVMRINVFSIIKFCQETIKYFLVNHKGCIINISSNLAFSCLPYNLPYTLSKASINALTKTIAKEYMQENIVVNSICPSIIGTDMFKNYIREEAQKSNVTFEEMKKFLLDTMPQKRWLLPEEVASFICFLISDDARGITGQSLPINMGSYMY